MLAMSLMIFYAILCATGVCVCQFWSVQFRTADWIITNIHQTVNMTIVSVTAETDSLYTCTLYCSSPKVGDIASLYFIQATNTCHCNSKKDNRSEDNGAALIQYGLLPIFRQGEISEILQTRTNVIQPERDCEELYNKYGGSGVYETRGWNGARTLVKCNFGMTVIQRRFDGSVNFNRSWEDYRLGFGDVNGEFWIGLENLHYLTSLGTYIRVEYVPPPSTGYPNEMALYFVFIVGDRNSDFRIEVGDLNWSSATDAFTYHSGQRFSTFDKDNDESTEINCALKHEGGWWFKSCLEANLNGHYYTEMEYSMLGQNDAGIHWGGKWCSMKETTMSLGRLAT